MNPYYENESGKLLNGSALEILRQLESESVQCCVTSPPYWNMRDYDVEGQIGLEKTPEEYVEKMVEIFREVKRVLKADGTLWLNLGDSYYSNASNYQGNVGAGQRYGKDWTPEKRINKAINHDVLKTKDLIGIPWTVAFALRADGWYLRQDIVWSKSNPMPESVKDRCTKAHEYIFLLTRSPQYYFDQDAILEPCSLNTHLRVSQDIEKQKGSSRAHGGGVKTMKAVLRDHKNLKRLDPHTLHKNRVKSLSDFQDYAWGKVEKRNKRSVWTVNTKGFSEAHFATFPEKLIIPCILAGSQVNDIVFDPFMGSGTVAVVSHKLGRSWLGIELSKDYCNIARARIKEASKQGIIPGFNQ